MKVIHYIASIDQEGGGTTEYMRLMSMALKATCTLVIATGKSDAPIAIDGVATHFFDTKFTRYFSLLKEFKIFLQEQKPDIVHINGIWNPENWLFQKVAQELNIKVIISPHGMLEPWILANNPWKKKLALFLYQRKALERADYLHATAAMEEVSIQHLGFTKPITIIPNGIDTSEITQIKTNYGSRKMIFISRIHPKKGIELLLEAWAGCDTKDWTLEIAGNGDADYIDTLKKSAQKIKNVSFVGPQYGEAKWDFIRSADVMVLPTYSENFGIVVAEALATGVPVITTTGTPWNDLETYNCGWWIDLSVHNLRKVISESIMVSPKKIEAMGANGKTLIASKYEIKEVANQMYKLYQKMLNE